MFSILLKRFSHENQTINYENTLVIFCSKFSTEQKGFSIENRTFIIENNPASHPSKFSSNPKQFSKENGITQIENLQLKTFRQNRNTPPVTPITIETPPFPWYNI